MGSRNSTCFYDGATLGALAQAFRETWAELQARYPSRDWVRDHELRSALADRLLVLADKGLNDPAELQRVALENLADMHGRREAGAEKRSRKAA
jgi:hypothetical protein